MENSKKGLLLFRHRFYLYKEICPKGPKEIECMSHITYTSVVGSFIYAMLCIKLDIT